MSTLKSKEIVKSCETTATERGKKKSKNEEDRRRARRDRDCLTY